MPSIASSKVTMTTILSQRKAGPWKRDFEKTKGTNCILRWLTTVFPRPNTPIANMATISPKRGFSVVTVAKGWPALFFQEFFSLCTEKYWMLKSTGRPVFGQISSKYSKIHLRGVAKVRSGEIAVFTHAASH